MDDRREPAEARDVLYFTMVDRNGREVSMGDADSDQTIGDLRYNIFRMSPDGAAVNLTCSADYEVDPVVSPDGERIAFTAFAGEGSRRADVYVMNRDGTDRSAVTQCPLDTYALSPAWSPDGRWLAMELCHLEGITGTNRPPLIAIIPAKGGDFRRVAPGRLPSWFPEGDALLITDWEGGLRRVPAARGRSRSISDPRCAGGVCSPDGLRIAYTAYRELSRGVLAAASADGSCPVELTEHAAPPGTDPALSDMVTDVCDSFPRWEPDGRHLVFSRWLDVSPWGPTPIRAELHRLDVETRELRRLSLQGAWHLTGGGGGMAVMLAANPPSRQ